jgi:DNA polymerase-3 subunit gamma/tau
VSDPAAVRQVWPQVLEAVARRSKVAWVMMQSVHVMGVEGRLLQLGFSSSGLRDNFHGSNREETLRESLREVTGVDWKIDAMVDPSAGIATAGPPPVASVPAPVAMASSMSTPTVSAASAANGPAAQSEGASTTSPSPASNANADSGATSFGATSAPPPPFAAPAPYSPPPFAQPTTPPEEDEPDPDDEDVADAGPTARDLLMRELGATVLQEGSDGD